MKKAAEDKLAEALSRFDAANSADPNIEELDGISYPKELLYAQRMTRWLDALEPDAPEAVQLAVRAQHICRWQIPRNQYPMDRQGYLAWRTELGKFHARTAGDILQDVGYDQEMVAKVQKLLRKEELKQDPEVQLLEDVACLVFLESYFADFSAKHEQEKVIQIVQRTWRKMSERAHRQALKLPLPEFVTAALSP